MLTRKVEARIAVPHRRAQSLRQLHHMVPAVGRAGGEVRHDDRAFGRGQGVGRLFQRRRVRHHRRGHVHVVLRRHHYVVVQGRLLQAGVVAHVDGSLLAAHHHRIGPGKRARHGVDGGGLGVPLDVVADGLALDAGRMDPVNERTPLGFFHGAGGPHDENGRPVEIGVVDAHGSVQQPYQVMDNGDHRLAAGAGVAMSDLHRDLLVVAQHHGRVVLAVVHQRVVESPVAGAGIQGDVLEPVALDHVHDDVRLPLAIRLLDLGRFDLFRFAHVCFLSQSAIR